MPPSGRADAVSQPGLGVPPLGGLVLALGIALVADVELAVAVTLATAVALGRALVADATMLAATDALVAGAEGLADGALLACGLALDGTGGVGVLDAGAAGLLLAAATAVAVG